MNLHDIVRGAITSVNADQAFTLYTATGNFARSYETLETVPEVLPGVSVQGQIQTISPDAVIRTERVLLGSIVRRIYLRASEGLSVKPTGIYRPLARAGDYLDDHLGQRWQVDALLEDFSAEGWVSVQAILMQVPQALSIREDPDDNTDTDSD